MKNWFKITAILLFLFPAVGFLQAGPRTGDDVAAAGASHFHFFQNQKKKNPCDKTNKIQCHFFPQLKTPQNE